MTERIAVPVVNLIPRPDGVEAWQASLLEPIAVGLNSVDRLQIELGESIVVLGQGPIGLALTRLCALPGAGKLIVTDAREAPFAVSRAYGASDCIDVTTTDPVQAVLDLTDGKGADLVIETSGFPASTKIVLDCVRKEGKVAHIGWANDLPPLPVIPIMAKTLTVYGVRGNGGRGQYERAQELGPAAARRRVPGRLLLGLVRLRRAHGRPSAAIPCRCQHRSDLSLRLQSRRPSSG